MKNKSSLSAVLDVKAFTLIELLVVVLIIGILAAVALPKYEMAVMRSRYSTLKSLTRALYEAEQLYHMANGVYTSDMEVLSVDVSGCTLSANKTTCTYPWGRCVADATNGRVSCENTQTLQNGYAMYLGVGPNNSTWGVNCWAFSTNKTDKYNQLCKKEGGVFKTTGGCTGVSGSCQIYKISAAL